MREIFIEHPSKPCRWHNKMLTNTKVLENHSPLTLYTDISFTTSCESNKKHNKQQFEKSFKRGNLVYSIYDKGSSIYQLMPGGGVLASVMCQQGKGWWQVSADNLGI